MGNHNLSALLANRNFRYYSASQIAHASGTWTHLVGELWLVYEITQSGFVVGVAASARSAGSLMLAPLAGTITDRVDRQTMLVRTHTVKAVIAGTLAFLVATMSEPSLVILLAAAVILGLLGAVDLPLRRAFVRDVVASEHLKGAAGLYTTVITAGKIVAGGVSAILLGLSMVWACFALNCVTAIAVAMLTRRIVPETFAASQTESKGNASREKVLAYLSHAPTVTIPLLLSGAFALLHGNIETIMPVIIERQLNAQASTIGLLVLSIGVGTIIGSAIASSSPKGSTTGLCLMLGVYGCVVAPASTASNLASALMLFGLIGAAEGVFMSLSSSLVQTSVDPFIQGRVTAIYGAIFIGSRFVGAPAFGWAVDTFGTSATLLTAGATTALLGMITYFGVRNKMQRYQANVT